MAEQNTNQTNVNRDGKADDNSVNKIDNGVGVPKKRRRPRRRKKKTKVDEKINEESARFKPLEAVKKSDLGGDMAKVGEQVKAEEKVEGNTKAKAEKKAPVKSEAKTPEKAETKKVPAKDKVDAEHKSLFEAEVKAPPLYQSGDSSRKDDSYEPYKFEGEDNVDLPPHDEFEEKNIQGASGGTTKPADKQVPYWLKDVPQDINSQAPNAESRAVSKGENTLVENTDGVKVEPVLSSETKPPVEPQTKPQVELQTEPKVEPQVKPQAEYSPKFDLAGEPVPAIEPELESEPELEPIFSPQIIDSPPEIETEPVPEATPEPEVVTEKEPQAEVVHKKAEPQTMEDIKKMLNEVPDDKGKFSNGVYSALMKVWPHVSAIFNLGILIKLAVIFAVVFGLYFGFTRGWGFIAGRFEPENTISPLPTQEKISTNSVIDSAVTTSEYFGFLREPSVSGETGLTPALYYGKLMDESEGFNQYVAYVDNLEELKNLYETDVYDLLDRNTQRDTELFSYLAKMNDSVVKSEKLLRAIRLNIDQMKTSFNTLSPEKDKLENDFFVSLQELKAGKSDVLLKRFVDVSQKQTALKARVYALETLADYYENALFNIKNRIESVEKNQDALIAGVRVTEVSGAGIDLIIREK